MKLRVRSITSNYTANVYDDVILVDASSGNIVVTLAGPIVGNTVFVKKTDSSANTVTISRAGTTIDGSGSKVLSYQYDALTIASNGTNFFIV